MPMYIMNTRHEGLEQALAGLKRTGIPLVGLDAGTLYPAAAREDAASLYFVPKLALLLRCDLERAILLFYGGLIFFAFLCGMAGAFLYCKSAGGRALAGIGLALLSVLAYRTGDVYIASFAAPVLVIPLLLYFLRRGKWDAGFGGFLGAAGFFISLASWIRAQAGVPTLLFVLVALWFGWKASGKTPVKTKSLATLCLFAGFMLPQLFFTWQYQRCDSYLEQTQGAFAKMPNRHVLWHSIYIGLGFRPNPYGLAYKDELAMAKARSIDPNVVYCSQEYEAILRRETLKFAAQHPGFVVKTLAVKCLFLLRYFLLAANVGLLALPRARLPRPLLAAFAAALAFSALPGLLVIPNSAYLLGFITCSALFGIVSMMSALMNNDAIKNATVRSGE